MQLPVVSDLVPADKVLTAIQPATRIDGRNRRLLVYIHVPFCNSKCLFCDWVVHQTTQDVRSGRERGQRELYVDAVCRQIEKFGPELSGLGYQPEMVVWGGGTPSILDPDQITQICQTLYREFDLSKITSHTFEVSPETVTEERLVAMVENGVDRITMGAQSFDTDELRRMGRSHGVEDIGRAVALMKAAGIRDINIDLMNAMPEQVMSTFRDNLLRSIEVDPTHVTIFPYRPTQGTVWGDQMRKGKRTPSNLAFALESHAMAREILGEAGFVNYMVTAFQRKERTHIPRGPAFYYATGQGDYVGLGCGGLSILGHHRLESCTRAVKRFISDPFQFDSLERFSMEGWDTIFAIVFMSLGTDFGLGERQFTDLFGMCFQDFLQHPRTQGMLAYYQSCGAQLVHKDGRYIVTEETRAKAYITAHLASSYRN